MIEYDLKNARTWSKMGMCGALGTAAMELGETSANTVFLTADLCFFSGLDRYKEAYGDNLYNFGIAEQNMIGAAGGIAKEGIIPFATTYASFAASRCADQVRVNMAYMKLPIKLVGLTAGYGAGILGATHMSVEDIAVMRALPNIIVISPADCMEAIKCILAAAKNEEPTYIRLSGQFRTPIVYKEDYDFRIGKIVELKRGTDVCILATGSMVYYSMQAASQLEEQGISCSVLNVHTIKPLDEDAIIKAADEHSFVVTVEEHNINGGFGSAICECLARNRKSVPTEMIGIEDLFVKPGNYDFQLKESGLSTDQITKRILTFVKGE